MSAGLADLVRQRCQALHERGNGAGEVVVAAGQAYLDPRHGADQAVADDLRRLVEVAQRALPGAGLPDDACSSRTALTMACCSANGFCQRLFAVDILLAGGGFGGDTACQ